MPLMSAMPQKLLRHWVEGASVAAPFVAFSAKLQCPLTIIQVAVGVEKISLNADGEKLRGRDDVVIE